MDNGYLIGLSEELIPTPALLLDIAVAEKNMETIMGILSHANTSLRPHIKTHKTPMLAHLQMKAGALGLCCATVGEAEVMAHAGLDHILITSEVVGDDKVRRVVNMARYQDIMVVVDNDENLSLFSSVAGERGVKLGVLVDFDVGMGRCGVRSIKQAVELARKAHDARGIHFRGIMGYEGHAVLIENRSEREQVGRQANAMLVEAVKAVEAAGIPVEIVTGGGTGTFDIISEFPEITEVQAGSYIFMDRTYQKLELPFEQALTVLSTIISRPTDRDIILDVGMKAISVERACPTVQGLEGLEICKLSEEHANACLKNADSDLRPGNKLKLIPSHCCTTVNLHHKMYIVRDGIIEAIWQIAARGAI